MQPGGHYRSDTSDDALPMALLNTVLLLAQAVVYFGVMAALFRARDRIGLGAFLCALGVMHFLETYLASVFYIELPFGIISPGSTVLFSGKLAIILMMYIREDAAVVRQPIYGLLIGNFLMVALVMLLRNHDVVSAVPGRLPDFKFVDEMGWLMVWGTTLLFIDAIAMILLYERLGPLLRRWPVARSFVALGAILSFDQAGFFLALHYVSGAPWYVMFGGWCAKMGAALVYSLLVGAYLRWGESRTGPAQVPMRLADVFQTLTYRERYEDLLKRSGRDSLTGAYDRGRLEAGGGEIVDTALQSGRPVSLLLIDLDGFKIVNDQHGHAHGDNVLRGISQTLAGRLRKQDHLFRYGGDEFVVLCDGLSHGPAFALGEQLRRAVIAATAEQAGGPLTACIGVATCPHDAIDIDQLFEVADNRLYVAKHSGRDRVVGRNEADSAALSARA